MNFEKFDSQENRDRWARELKNIKNKDERKERLELGYEMEQVSDKKTTPEERKEIEKIKAEALEKAKNLTSTFWKEALGDFYDKLMSISYFTVNMLTRGVHSDKEIKMTAQGNVKIKDELEHQREVILDYVRHVGENRSDAVKDKALTKDYVIERLKLGLNAIKDNLPNMQDSAFYYFEKRSNFLFEHPDTEIPNLLSDPYYTEEAIYKDLIQERLIKKD